MNVTQEQARDSLNEIREVTSRLRRSVAATDASGHMMLWGLVWVGAFLSCGIWPERTGLAWGIGNSIGGIGSMIIGIRNGRRSSVESQDAGRQGWRFAGLWLTLFFFVGVWAWLLKPTSGPQFAAFVCTAVMFAYVIMGLWFEAGFLAWLGFGITVLTVVGYQTLPEHFYFWMAGTGGGSLFVAGLYISRAWK